MNFSNTSNLMFAIKTAIDDCYEYGSGESIIQNYHNDRIVKIIADWVESKRKGYSVVQITIKEDGVVKLVYDDYGTECIND